LADAGLRLADVPEPECPPGWVTGPPDLVGVGAQRCGTSWWFRGAIRPHPGFVRRTEPIKEVHFFEHFWHGEVPNDIAERYARLFPRPAGAVTGEWTPRYMVDPWTISLLARAAPQARILIMLRDPVERYHSGIARELRQAGRESRDAYISVIGDALYRGLYHDQVRHVLDCFGRDQVLVLQYERCRAEPLAEMRRTHAFLGLEPLEELPPRLDSEPRPRPDKVELHARLRAELVRVYRDDVQRLARLCPELDLSLWPDFGR
jgi:hypothetical protein